MAIDGTEPPKPTETKTTKFIKVSLNQSSQLKELEDGTLLKNPIEINLSGKNFFIYTKQALENIIQTPANALSSPLSTQEDPRFSYKLDPRKGFLAQLEEGIELSSDGKGLFELTKTSSGQRTTLLDATQELQYLIKVNAFEKEKKASPQSKDDLARILELLHQKKT